MEVVSSQYLSLPQQTSSLSPVCNITLPPSLPHSLPPSQTLQYIKNVVEQISQRALLVAMATPLIGHMTSCLLSCDVRPSSDSHRIKRLGNWKLKFNDVIIIIPKCSDGHLETTAHSLQKSPGSVTMVTDTKLNQIWSCDFSSTARLCFPH